LYVSCCDSQSVLVLCFLCSCSVFYISLSQLIIAHYLTLHMEWFMLVWWPDDVIQFLLPALKLSNSHKYLRAILSCLLSINLWQFVADIRTLVQFSKK
jgi:hypothetical protein